MYANIPDIPFTIDDVGYGRVGFVDHPEYEDAIATIMIARASHRLTLVQWGVTEISQPFISPIGIGNLKSCNMRKLQRK
jgi:hypothetical protein